VSAQRGAQRARGGAAARGFTLLEVMAAVLVLGMLYAVLANAAMRGLRSEGDSRRRIQASLLADLWLAERELELSLGQIPKEGQIQEQVESYVVDVTVAPFDPTILMAASEELARKRPSRTGSRLPSRTAGTPGAGAADAAGTGAAGRGAGAAGSAGFPGAQTGQGLQGTPGAPIDPNAPALGESLLTPPGPGQAGRLRRIDIAVRWQEGAEERRVTRTTFAFDTSGLEQLFPESGGGGAGEPGADEEQGSAKQIEDMLKQLGGAGGGAPDEEPVE
jgi:prepilin-type N-terminal cleavage/methylation domain-containing protein